MVLWALGGLVDDLVGIFGKAWQQDEAKWTKLGSSWQQVAQVGTKLAASCGQELPRCCQDGQLGHFVASFGTISDQFCFFCVSFLRVGGNSEKYENEQQSITFA
jgi:hypothetical protein